MGTLGNCLGTSGNLAGWGGGLTPGDRAIGRSNSTDVQDRWAIAVGPSSIWPRVSPSRICFLEATTLSRISHVNSCRAKCAGWGVPALCSKLTGFCDKRPSSRLGVGEKLDNVPFSHFIIIKLSVEYKSVAQCGSKTSSLKIEKTVLGI